MILHHITHLMNSNKRPILLYIARAVAFVWAAFWLFFGISSGLGEGLNLSGIIMHVLFPGVLFLAIALFAWRWPLHGATVLMLSGLAVLILYPLEMREAVSLSTILFVVLTMGVPPLIAGGLMFIHARTHPPTFPFKTDD